MSLQSRNEWRFAPTIMQTELNNTLASGMESTVRDALEVCDFLDQSSVAALRYRGVVLKNRVAAITASAIPQMATRLLEQLVATIMGICPSNYGRWDDFCPLIAIDITKIMIINSAYPTFQKLDEMQQMAQSKIEQGDYAKANQLLIACRNMARDCYLERRGTLEAATTLRMFRDLHESFVDFHENRSRIVYFEAAVLNDYLDSLSINFHDITTIVERVQSFQSRHPEFAIPGMQESMLGLGKLAARELGLAEKQWIFSREQAKWLRCCNFREGGAYIGNRISDYSVVTKEIITDGETLVEWRLNAMKVLLCWAGQQVERSRMSREQCEMLFGPELTGLPTRKIGDYVEGDVNIAAVDCHFYGTLDQPSDPHVSWVSYNNFQDWLLTDDDLPSLDARLFVLRVLAQSRVSRLCKFFVHRGTIYTESEYIALCEEIELSKRVGNMEDSQNHNFVATEEANAWKLIHMTVLKCYVPQSGSRRVHAEELRIGIEASRALIIRQRNNQNLLREYEATMKLLELQWQQYLHFGEADPKDLLPHAEGAETLFISVRNAVKGLRVTDDLAAKAQMFQQYSQRQQYNFAFAALVAALDLTQQQPVLEPGMTSNEDALVSKLTRWTLRSKGRGFSDVVDANKDLHSGDSRLNHASKENDVANGLTSRGGKLKVTAKLSHDLQIVGPSDFTEEEHEKPLDEFRRTIDSLPDDVVIIDYVNIRYGSDGARFIAMVHRSGHATRVVKLPEINAEKIDAWVAQHLDQVEQKRQQELNEDHAEESLTNLNGLLNPLVYAEPQMVIKPTDTIVICPTGSMHRISIHGLPVDGKLSSTGTQLCTCLV